MSIKVTWTPMGSTPDTLTIYWSDTVFTPETLPANNASLTPTDTAYTDTTVGVNAFRYYMVKATKAGRDDLFSQCLLLANIPNTLPGRNTPLRGDWSGGLLDILTPAQFFSAERLKAALSLPAGWGGNPEFTLTAWFKFVYKGKILYIPSGPLSAPGTLGWSDLYNAGLIYGTDDNGSPPMDLVALGASPAIPALVNQLRVISVAGSKFLVRTPRLSDKPTNQLIDTTHDSYVNGEWWNTICRSVMNTRIEAADIPRLPVNRWNDYVGVATQYQCAATPHFFTVAGSLAAVSASNYSGHIARNIKQAPSLSAVHWVPVLEYIGPDENGFGVLQNVELFGTLPAAVANFQAGIGSNRLHVFAGQTTGPTHRQIYSRLNKDTKVWANSANIAALSWGGGCYCGDSFYAGGGTNATAYTNAFWKLNPDTGAGSNLANIPGALRGQAKFVAISPTVLHMVGGYEISAGKTSALHYKYDTTTNVWTLLAPLPLSLNGHSAGAYNGKLYVMGGYNETAGNSGDVREYDPVNNTWTVIGTAPVNSSWVGGCVYKNYIIMAIVQNGMIALQIFDLVTKKWTRNETGISQRWALEMVADDSGVYIMGGVNSNTVGSGTWYTAARYTDIYRIYD